MFPDSKTLYRAIARVLGQKHSHGPIRPGNGTSASTDQQSDSRQVLKVLRILQTSATRSR